MRLPTKKDVQQYGKLLISVAGIYTCYLMYGVYQEALYKRQANGVQFANTAFVLFVQCATNGIVALLGHWVQEHMLGGAELRAKDETERNQRIADHNADVARQHEREIELAAAAAAATAGANGRGAGAAPSAAGEHHAHSHSHSHWKPGAPRISWLAALRSMEVVKTSLVYVLAMYTSNEALAFVSYPTQALVKSCKMIPVMIGSILISRRRYSTLKYVCVALMSAGIAWFQFAAPKKAKGAHGPVGSAGATAHVGPLSGENLGMLLLGVSLCLDGVTGPLQEVLRSDLRLTSMEQMLVNNVWGGALMLAIALALDQVGSSLTILSENPSLLWALVLFSLCSAFGQVFVFWTIREFNALTLTTITTTRKFFTILVSVVVHGNALAGKQWFAVATVFAGLFLEAFDKEPKHGHGHAHKHRHKVKVDDAPGEGEGSAGSGGNGSGGSSGSGTEAAAAAAGADTPAKAVSSSTAPPASAAGSHLRAQAARQ